MITHIEIDGFKSFHDFSIDLLPFQVFIGPNAVGKSNLFDAIMLLSNLASDKTVYEAFRNTRGEIKELFTSHPDGRQEQSMRFVVDMLIPKEITDILGVPALVSSTRLRYELQIERFEDGGFERLFVTREQLTSIPEDDDTWVRDNIHPTRSRADWVFRARRTPYISTSKDEAHNQWFIYKHQDRRSGAKQETPVNRVERTILSTITTAEYPTAYAARQEMLNWRFLQLEPAELRAPSGIYSPTQLLPSGSNLAAVLYRILREDEFAFNDVTLDMIKLIPGIRDIIVETLVEREEFLIEAETQDGHRFSSRVLSDGTLRLLALVTLKNDPRHRGVLCFEEPENGVHPLRLKQIVEILQELSTSFEQGYEDNTLKQVLVNTHSPFLMSYVQDKSLLFVDVRGHSLGSATWMYPVMKTPMESSKSSQYRYYTVDQVKRALDPQPLTTLLRDLESN